MYVYVCSTLKVQNPKASIMPGCRLAESGPGSHRQAPARLFGISRVLEVSLFLKMHLLFGVEGLESLGAWVRNPRV